MFNRESAPKTNTIMKSIKNLLPALALVFGATLAVAMNFPETVAENTSSLIWTPDLSQPDGYREVTEIVNEDLYDCDQQTVECTVRFSNDDPATGIKTVIRTGVFSQQM